MRRGLTYAGGIMAAALAVCGVAAAQNQTIDDYVRGLLLEMATEDGETLPGEIETAEMETTDSFEVTFSIDPEKTYYVFGACDDDCTDVDISVTDSTGDFVDYDEEADDAPMLLILPDDAGDELIVTLHMIECETDTCIGGIGVFEADF